MFNQEDPPVSAENVTRSTSASPTTGRKVFRRKKRWQGATFTPKNTSAEIGDGAWCRFHKQRHGYMTMDITYEKNSEGRWQILWMCKQTHQVLETMILGGSK